MNYGSGIWRHTRSAGGLRFWLRVFRVRILDGGPGSWQCIPSVAGRVAGVLTFEASLLDFGFELWRRMNSSFRRHIAEPLTRLWWQTERQKHARTHTDTHTQTRSDTRSTVHMRKGMHCYRARAQTCGLQSPSLVRCSVASLLGWSVGRLVERSIGRSVAWSAGVGPLVRWGQTS